MKAIEQVPITVCRKTTGFAEDTLQLNAERCSGVLMHPVPYTDMLDIVGVNRPGRRLIVMWPAADRAMPYLAAGDLLAVNDETHVIAGVREYPYVYTEVYIAD